jgi:hypothetical protein
MDNLSRILIIGGISTGLLLSGCEKAPTNTTPGTSGTTGSEDDHAGHDHAEGDDHDDHDEELSLGTTTVGSMTIECWQGHGDVEAGKEMHLVVKLPYSDDGASIVRAWIGTDDRLMSMVAKADFAASHDDYDVHTDAPDPLPEGAKWWIEVTKPGSKAQVGSIAFK